MTTAGASDLAPRTAFFRIAYVVMSVIGITTLTLTVTYFLEIYNALQARNVYVSNRSHDSIGVFGIDAAKGTLTPRQWAATKGGVPRFFCFDPAARFLYVANQGGHTIVGYRVGRDGKLSPTPIRVKVASPACIVFSGAAS